MLEKLHDKFEDERTDLEKEESNARHAYEMLIQVFAGTLCFTIWSSVRFSLTFVDSHEVAAILSNLYRDVGAGARISLRHRSSGAAVLLVVTMGRWAKCPDP